MKMMSLKRSIHLALLAAAVAAPMAFAQDAATPPPPPMQDGSMQSTPAPSPTTTDDTMSSAKPMSWKELDANKDGKLSKDEVAGDATLTADFDTADANKDGYLSKAEYKAHRADLKKVAKK